MHVTFFLSDIHLGSSYCQRDLLLKFLHQRRAETDSVYILGDLLESPSVRLTEQDKAIVAELRRLEAVWILGNHDGPPKGVQHLGLTTQPFASLFLSHKRVGLLHGDQWDEFVCVPWRRQVVESLYTAYLKLGEIHLLKPIIRFAGHYFLRPLSALLTNNEKQQEEGALRWMDRHGHSAVVCGHTHLPSIKRLGVKLLLNCGSWTAPVPTYIEFFENRFVLSRYGGEVIDVAEF